MCKSGTHQSFNWEEKVYMFLSICESQNLSFYSYVAWHLVVHRRPVAKTF